jgi:hypothetical protein
MTEISVILRGKMLISELLRNAGSSTSRLRLLFLQSSLHGTYKADVCQPALLFHH